MTKLDQRFSEAAKAIKTLQSRPTNQELLQLYALYKQASEGKNTNKRPGLLDVAGRAKHDAWAELGGKSSEDCQHEYISLVDHLLNR